MASRLELLTILVCLVLFVSCCAETSEANKYKNKSSDILEWVACESQGGFSDTYELIDLNGNKKPVFSFVDKHAGLRFEMECPEDIVNKFLSLRIEKLPPNTTKSSERNAVDAPVICIIFHYNKRETRICRDYRRFRTFETRFERGCEIFSTLAIEARNKRKRTTAP